MQQSRSCWSDEETQHFLDLLLEKKLEGVLDAQLLKATDIFLLIGERMPKKSVPQLMVKWRNLKGSYFKMLKENKKSGKEKPIPFREELERLLGDQDGIHVTGGFDSIDVCTDNDNIVIMDPISEETTSSVRSKDSSRKRKADQKTGKPDPKKSRPFTEFMKEQNKQFFKFMSEEAEKEREWEERMIARHEIHQKTMLQTMAQTLTGLITNKFQSNLPDNDDSSEIETEIVYT